MFLDGSNFSFLHNLSFIETIGNIFTLCKNSSSHFVNKLVSLIFLLFSHIFLLIWHLFLFPDLELGISTFHTINKIRTRPYFDFQIPFQIFIPPLRLGEVISRGKMSFPMFVLDGHFADSVLELTHSPLKC